MRIGTWNLAGRWSGDHEALLRALACDLLVLTEVSDRLVLDDHHVHRTGAEMVTRRTWSAIATRAPLAPRPDPHFASAAALVDGIQVVSSILPWRGCGARWPGANTHARTALALEDIERSLGTGPIVWGGDWNHALSGREYAGSIRGRADVLALTERLRLQVPTAPLPHRIEGSLSIDHIAVSATARVVSAERIVAERDGRRLSDHDAYVVEVG